MLIFCTFEDFSLEKYLKINIMVNILYIGGFSLI